MNDKRQNQEDQFQAAEDHYAELQQLIKRRRIYNVAVFALVVIIAIGLLFSGDLVDYFTSGRKQQAVNRIEKDAKAKMIRVTDADRKLVIGKAKELLDNGKVDDALKLLLNHLGQDPQLAEAHYLTGMAYIRQGQIQSAYSHLKQATTLKPDYYEALEKLGEIYLLGGDYKAAREISSRLTKGAEYLQDGLLLESEISLAEGNREAAMEKARAALTGPKEQTKARTSAFLADLYTRQGDAKRADEIINKLDLAAMDAEGLLSLAKFYLGSGNAAKASPFFQQALKRYPDSAEVNYNYAQYLFNKGQANEAIAYYKKAMVAMPNVQIIAYRLSECLLAAGQREEVKNQIDAMSMKYPNSILASGLKIQYHLLNGERRQAIDELNRLTTFIPKAPRPYIILASLYWQEGMMPQAERNAVKAMTLGEKTVLPHLMIADILLRKGQFPQALSYYDRVLEVDAANLVALLQTGDLYLRLGEPKKAEERYARAVAAYPKIKSLQIKVAWAKAKGGDVEGALALNREYLRAAPNDPEAVAVYANTLALANRLNEAVDAVQKSIKQQPRAWSLRFLMGDFYLLKNDFRAAAASYANALALNAGDINLALNVGERYEKNAPEAETERYYVELRKKMPDNTFIANQLAWFYIDRMGEPRKAKELVESLMKEKDWPEMKDTIGWYYFNLGDFVNAEHYFRGALQLAPDRHNIRARLALTLYSLKRNQEGAAEAQQVTALLTSGPLKSKLEAAVANGKIGP